MCVSTTSPLVYSSSAQVPQGWFRAEGAPQAFLAHRRGRLRRSGVDQSHQHRFARVGRSEQLRCRRGRRARNPHSTLMQPSCNPHSTLIQPAGQETRLLYAQHNDATQRRQLLATRLPAFPANMAAANTLLCAALIQPSCNPHSTLCCVRLRLSAPLVGKRL